MDGALSGPARIFVVDDDDAMRSLLARILMLAGYEPVLFDDPVLALSAVRTSVQVDLIITDLDMNAVMSGLDLARAARHSRPGLPVILVTGSMVAPPLPDVTAIVRKPFRLLELELTVRNCLAAT